MGEHNGTQPEVTVNWAGEGNINMTCLGFCRDVVRYFKFCVFHYDHTTRGKLAIVTPNGYFRPIGSYRPDFV